MALSLALLLFVQYGLIQGFVKLAARFELAFVNSMGLPFNTGVAVYLAMVIALIVAALWWSRQKGWWQLNVAALSVAMILVGYSTFALIVVRSGSEPAHGREQPGEPVCPALLPQRASNTAIGLWAQDIIGIHPMMPRTPMMMGRRHISRVTASSRSVAPWTPGWPHSGSALLLRST